MKIKYDYEFEMIFNIYFHLYILIGFNMNIYI